MARKKSTRPLGMPRNSALRRQAMQIAQSSVTPASQIRHQYGRAQDDAAGFTDALVSLLQGQQAAYNGIASDSQAQQSAIDNAAVSRLGGLGDFSQGSMGATGALGTSAETRTNAMGTALRAFGAQQPGIAGSRGLLTKESLNNALQDALDQRRTQLHQAFLQAYPQVQQNAFSQRLALANLGLQQQQFAEQQREFDISTQQRADLAGLSARTAAAKASTAERHWRLDFIAKNGFDPYTGRTVKTPGSGGTSAPPGFTPAEWRAGLRDAAKVVAPPPDVTTDSGTGRKVRTNRRNFAQQGIPFLDAVRQLVSQGGFDRRLAVVAVIRLYKQYSGAPRNSPAYKAWASYFDFIHPTGKVNTELTGPH